jgi:hypothetical protein
MTDGDVRRRASKALAVREASLVVKACLFVVVK